MDWFSELYIKFGWKTTKLVMAPFWYQLVCLHPDTVKVVLKGGVPVCMCVCVHMFVYTVL